MKFSSSTVSAAIAATGALFGQVTGDPVPPELVPCKVFCFRITDIRCDADAKNGTGTADADKFHFEFEVLNWANTFAGGVDLAMSTLSSPGVEFDANPYLGGLDVDGRPLILEDTNNDGVTGDIGDLEDLNMNGIMEGGEDQNANKRFDNDFIPGNLRRLNDWNLIHSSKSKMEWQMDENSTALPFINLLNAADPGAGGSAQRVCNCITTLPFRDLFQEAVVNNQATGDITPTELIDNGDNVQDGFVMSIDGFEIGKSAVINWFLKGAGGFATKMEEYDGADESCRVPTADAGLGEPLGIPFQGNPMGFGVVTITRIVPGTNLSEVPIQLLGQTGIRQTGTEFYDNVWHVPGCGEFALEFSPGRSCSPRNENDDNGAVCNCQRPNRDPACGGDPHFTTWTGEKFSFHGECDMVLVRNPNFDQGKGMHIHGRAKIHRDWSSFESAAIQIGDDTFEVHGKTDYFVNGVQHGESGHKEFTLSGYRVTVDDKGEHIRTFAIHLGPGRGRIFVKAYDEFVWVTVQRHRLDDFRGASGLLGSYETGQLLARDGLTILEDPNEFGQEWQVRAMSADEENDKAEDPMIFHEAVGPQYPFAQCKLPPNAKVDTVEKIRRLRVASEENEKFYQRAKQVCREHTKDVGSQEDCIADVMQTKRLDLAGAY